jgi:hypothetical protein
MFWKKGKDKGKEEPVAHERRKFPRFAQRLPLQLRTNDTPFKAMTLDISHGGLRIESTRELPPGAIVYFKPDETSTHSISGIGEVKWCKPSAKQNYYEFGVASYFITTYDMMDWAPGTA